MRDSFVTFQTSRDRICFYYNILYRYKQYACAYMLLKRAAVSVIITISMNDPANKPHIWTRIHGWIHRHHTATYVIAGVGLIAAASLITLALLYQKPVAL